MAAVELSAGAEQDLRDAAHWYEGQRATLGDEFTAELTRCLLLIGEAPERWPVHPGRAGKRVVRRFVMDHFPFSIAYLVRGQSVVVVAIAHTSRRPEYWRDRIRRRGH
jgi:plasmid stabilization system protein ParE